MQRRLFFHAGAVFTAIFLAGCLIIPTDYYTAHSRENTGEKPQESIIPGTTTRQEVLLKLGEPDEISPDETELWYDAEKVKALVIVGDRGGAIILHYLLIIRFDKNGVVESQRVEELAHVKPKR